MQGAAHTALEWHTVSSHGLKFLMNRIAKIYAHTCMMEMYELCSCCHSTAINTYRTFQIETGASIKQYTVSDQAKHLTFLHIQGLDLLSNKVLRSRPDFYLRPASKREHTVY